MKKFVLYVPVLMVLLLCSNSFAQLNPLSAQYFNNLYLGNPAYAGQEKGLTVNMSFRKQWSNIPGSPLVQNLTADYSKNKVGLGLNVSFDKAGLQRQTRVVGTYAYHLPLNDANQQLHFGISFGFMNQRLADNEIVGNTNDPLTANYNQRETYMDGDFGLAYSSTKLKVEAALPNLKKFFKRNEIKLADYSTFYSAISYKISISEGVDGIGVEPKLAYRGIKGFDNVLDAGTQLTLANRQVIIMGMYHSSKSASFGLGLDYKGNYLINGSYTTQTAGLSNYTNGSFEINLRARF
ncbi:type IX secretion system membrane protein PorP/SprF [Pedobacter frigiditerrae]|uniref:Type IX secretion system membrane protein PorP/SprF n=1 Tax=Pedobacter frigiditerrae TaxID=2530452 RepID=A0A4V2MI80_9SPHI|nr:PorP/SprF family type IX secretion system membrane protein [Pedobacter frigiditerrae]TCC89346.1 type IX secretion system membrane protein PorP/SprF [Pedobacter frigiditerrae]